MAKQVCNPSQIQLQLFGRHRRIAGACWSPVWPRCTERPCLLALAKVESDRAGHWTASFDLGACSHMHTSTLLCSVVSEANCFLLCSLWVNRGRWSLMGECGSAMLWEHGSWNKLFISRDLPSFPLEVSRKWGRLEKLWGRTDAHSSRYNPWITRPSYLSMPECRSAVGTIRREKKQVGRHSGLHKLAGSRTKWVYYSLWGLLLIFSVINIHVWLLNELYWSPCISLGHT